MKLKKKKPHADSIQHIQQQHTGISYRTALLLEPATLLGCLLGVIINVILPPFAILFLLIVVCTLSAYKTVSKAVESGKMTCREVPAKDKGRDIEMHAFQETSNFVSGGDNFDNDEDDSDDEFKDMEEEENSFLINHHQNHNQLNNDHPKTSGRSSSSSRVLKKNNSTISLIEQFDNNNNKFLAGTTTTKTGTFLPVSPKIVATDNFAYWALVFDWGVNLTIILITGGPLALICGDSWRQICLAALMVFHGVFIFTNQKIVSKTLRREIQEYGYDDDPSTHWIHSSKFFMSEGIAACAGLVAASVGIGGGLIKGPLLLTLGVPPRVTVATSNYMVVFTSSTNVIAYAVAGRLTLYRAAWYFSIAFIGGSLGGYFLYSQANENRVTWVLLASITLSACAMLGIGIYDEDHLPGPDKDSLRQALFLACEPFKRNRVVEAPSS